MTVTAYQPPQDFRVWADATGYGTTSSQPSTAARPLAVRPLRHGPQRRGHHDPRADRLPGRAEADLLGPRPRRLRLRRRARRGRRRPQQLLRDQRPDAAGWWKGCYPEDGEYPIKYAGTKAFDADSDGDGILDGADDQDFDDIPNIMELSRNMAGDSPIQPLRRRRTSDPAIPATTYVNPFNPCLPDMTRGPARATRHRAGLRAVRPELGARSSSTTSRSRSRARLVRALGRFRRSRRRARARRRAAGRG